MINNMAYIEKTFRKNPQKNGISFRQYGIIRFFLNVFSIYAMLLIIFVYLLSNIMAKNTIQYISPNVFEWVDFWD